jgi:hypothetical protein
MKINEKYITVDLLFKNDKKSIHFYLSIEDSEIVLVFEHNETCQVLSEQTSDSSAFLNAPCLLKYVLNRKQCFSYFDPG